MDGSAREIPSDDMMNRDRFCYDFDDMGRKRREGGFQSQNYSLPTSYVALLRRTSDVQHTWGHTPVTRKKEASHTAREDEVRTIPRCVSWGESMLLVANECVHGIPSSQPFSHVDLGGCKCNRRTKKVIVRRHGTDNIYRPNV